MPRKKNYHGRVVVVVVGEGDSMPEALRQTP